MLRCEKCDWNTDWQTFFKSYHKKQLKGGLGYQVFIDFVERYPKCSNVRDKLFQIDWVIHQCHVAVTDRELISGRPVAVNLVKGKMSQLIPFLENLPLAPDPRMQDVFNNWKRFMARTSVGARWLEQK